MIEELATLLKLQEIDDEAGKVRSEISQLEEKLGQVKDDLDSVAESLAEQQAQRDGLRAKQRELETEIDDVRSLVKKSDNRLMTIKNSREYRALQREIDDNKRRVTDMEEELIQVMEQLDEAEKAFSELDEEHKGLDSRYRDEKKEADTTIAKGNGDLEKMMAKLDKIAKSIRPALFSKYKNTIKIRNGHAVVPVESYVCRGCNLAIPPQTYNELQIGKEIKICPHCERFIYYRAVEEEAQ